MNILDAIGSEQASAIRNLLIEKAKAKGVAPLSGSSLADGMLVTGKHSTCFRSRSRFLNFADCSQSVSTLRDVD
jgi:hypothetical protein